MTDLEPMDPSDESSAGGDGGSDSDPTFGWTMVACLVVILGAPLVVRSRPAPVEAIAGWGSAIVSAGGIVAGVARIVLTKGKPFGDRDPVRDVTSRYLQLYLRSRFVVTVGLIAVAAASIVFTAFWYPRPDPHLVGTELEGSPEAYALAPLFLCLILLAGGIYGITIQLYWFRVVHRTRRSLESPTGTS